MDLTAAPAALDLLRRQVAALLSQIDTAALPRPDHIHARPLGVRGPEWAPARGWRLLAIDTPDSAGVVYIDHNGDGPADYRFDGPGNWEALRVEQARQIGLAFLAAAAHAEQHLAGVYRLPTPADTNHSTDTDGGNQ